MLLGNHKVPHVIQAMDFFLTKEEKLALVFPQLNVYPIRDLTIPEIRYLMQQLLQVDYL